MVERAFRPSGAIENIVASFPPFVQYLLTLDHPPIEATSSTNFRTSRRRLMENVVSPHEETKDHAEALALEYLAKLALRTRLRDFGFSVQLSPQSLEMSNKPEHKGVDLLISDTNGLVYLGIDVKLRTGRSIKQRDGYGWNKQLLSPYIYLSLGNFYTDIREKEKASVREWFEKCVVPRMNTTGKIPKLPEFCSYLIARIERSLHGYHERLVEPDGFTHEFGLPETKHELHVLKEKIALVHSLFLELQLSGY